MYCPLLTDYGAGRGQHNPPNNALERYFSRASPDYDDYLGYRKRALFRKRGKIKKSWGLMILARNVFHVKFFTSLIRLICRRTFSLLQVRLSVFDRVLSAQVTLHLTFSLLIFTHVCIQQVFEINHSHDYWSIDFLAVKRT